MSEFPIHRVRVYTERWWLERNIDLTFISSYGPTGFWEIMQFFCTRMQGEMSEIGFPPRCLTWIVIPPDIPGPGKGPVGPLP